MARLAIRPLEPGDAPEVLRSHNEVFASGEGASPPRSEALWQWTYERNPAGRRAFVALDGGRVVAHFAALPVRTLLDGREAVFAQGIDSFALPSHRGSAGGNAFLRTARAFFAAYGGSSDALYYGWPSERAWRLGSRMLAYEAVRTQMALVRPLGASAGEPGLEIQRLLELDHQALWLFERCAAELGAAAVRDARYLSWRFLEHPEGRYELLGARDERGILRGLSVYRMGRGPFAGLGCAVDWLAPSSEVEVGSALLAALERCARRDGASALALWLPESSRWFARLQELGFLVHPTPWRLAVASFTPRLDAQWMRTGWWSTLADSDLA
jgi:hypothetical protein